MRSRFFLPLSLFVLFLPSCMGIRRTPLPWVGDARIGSRAPGQGLHATGIGCSLEASYVEEEADAELPRRAFQVTWHMRNEGKLPLRFDWRRTRLSDDHRRRYELGTVLVWDEEREIYRAAPPTLEPGKSAILVARFPVSNPIELSRILHLALDWGYASGDRELRFRSRFQVR